MNKYKGIYKDRKGDVEADTLLSAKRELLNKLRVPATQGHMLSVMLVEKGGKEVVHTPDF